MSILFKIRAIPCVSNYLDPVVSLNSQKGRKALDLLGLTSVDYSLFQGSMVHCSCQTFKLLQLLAGSTVCRDEM